MATYQPDSSGGSRGQELPLDELGDLELLLDALPGLELVRLLADEPADQLGHPQGRGGPLGQVLQELAVVDGVVALAAPRPEAEQADQPGLADQRHDEPHAGRLERVAGR